MEIISFKAKARNGIIKIPEKYNSLSNTNLRITISEDKISKVKSNKIKIVNPYKDVTDKNKLRAIRKINTWQKK